jgi:hypothetical protein
MSARLGFPKNTPLKCVGTAELLFSPLKSKGNSIYLSNYYQVEEVFDKGISEAEQLGFRAMITSCK